MPSDRAPHHQQAPRTGPAIAAPPRRLRRSSNLWRLRPYLRPFRTRYAWMVVLSALGTAATIVVPLVTRAVIDGPVASGDTRGLWALGSLAVALGVIEAVFTFLRRWIVARATNGTELGIRTDLYAKLQRLPMAFHDSWESGQLLSRIMSDLSTIRRFLGFGLVFLFMNVVQIAVVVGLLLQMYAPLGVVVAVSIVPVALVCLRIERESTRLARQIQDGNGDVASTVEEGAHGVRVIKSFGRAEHLFARFDDRAVRLYGSAMARVRLNSVFFTFLQVIPNLTLILVLGLGAVGAAQGRITLGTLVAFITLLLSLVWPVSALGFLLSMAQESMTAADRIAEILDAPDQITDGSRRLERVRGRLTFDDVSFRFPGSDHDVLRHVDLDIRPGETVAVVGATGSGKTTLTALVPRLYDVTGGAVRIDGVDVRDLPLDQLRSVVAIAFEDPTLFSMSVRENLTLGRATGPDAASEAEIEAAIDVAQAHFVHDLPWGLDTRIGEQGLSLSGGQRQRLALARAVLARPAVLVLDDTLSALDVHTEALVEQALRRVLAGVTGIVVAHRASTVLLADRVAVLSGGTIRHVGTHAELLATVPEYRALMAADDPVRPTLETEVAA